MNKDTYREYVRPVVVLTAICFIVTLTLAFVYGITAPTIEARAKQDADNARKELLSDAEGFDEVKGKLQVSDDGKASVTECYKATNDIGYVMTVETKSFGGTLTMMVGIDDKGLVTGVVVTDHSDTPGVGTKDMTPEYLKQYEGLSEVKDINIKSDDQIDYISGASVTGEAIHEGVAVAISEFTKISTGSSGGDA